MPASRSEKMVATAGVVLSVCGFAYLFVDGTSMIPASLMMTGAGMAIWAKRNDPIIWKRMRQVSSLDIGDVLVLAGALSGVLVADFLELPTRHDRGIALLGPGLVFFAGIMAKVHPYSRKFLDQIARTRKP